MSGLQGCFAKYQKIIIVFNGLNEIHFQNQYRAYEQNKTEIDVGAME
jgi:hypothetical protein